MNENNAQDELTNCCYAPFMHPGYPDNDFCSRCKDHASPAEEEGHDEFRKAYLTKLVNCLMDGLGRTWHEIRNKQTGKIVFSSDDESESQSRLKDCWPVGEYELVTVREIKK